MLKTLLNFSLVITCFTFFISCDIEDPVIPEEPELITTLIYTLTPAGGGTDVILSFQDIDGDGGNAPIIVGGTLASNQSYIGTLDLLNEAESPAESITEEIQEEKEDHQFFFQSSISDLIITYNDLDADGNPVGLTTELMTGAAGNGNITIILKHKPKKNADGVSSGNISNAEGETDIEVLLPVVVE